MQFEDMTSCFECEKQQQITQTNFGKLSDQTNGISMRFKKDYDLFLHKYNQLMPSSESCGGGGGSNKNEPAILFEAKPLDLQNTLGQLMPCIGCRASVERFYKQLVQQLKHTNTGKQRKNAEKKFSYALDPILIDSQGNLTLKKALLQNPVSIFKLFYKDG